MSAPSWPSTITRGVLIVGPYMGTAGQYETLRVWVTPQLPEGVTHLVHAATGLVLAPFKETTDAVSDQVQVELPLCDDPQWTTPGGDPAPAWSYQVEAEVVSSTTHDTWVLEDTVAPTIAAPLVRLSGRATGSDLPTTPGPVGVREVAPGVYQITGTQVVEATPGQFRFSTTSPTTDGDQTA